MSPLSEKQWARQFVDLAQLCGWCVYHTHDSRRSQAGFPDYVCWRERVIYVELKTDTGRLSDDQDRVLGQLEAAGAEWYLLRPADFAEARQILQRVAVAA